MHARQSSLQRPPGAGWLGFLCGNRRRLVVLLATVALLVSGVLYSVRCYQGMGAVDHEEGMETVGVVNASPEEGHASQPVKSVISNGNSTENIEAIAAVEIEGVGLPRCYSSPDADPSAGVWRQTAGGIKDSPVDMINWEHSKQQYGFLHRCDATWKSGHSKEGSRPYWNWEPEKCSLDAVNREKFCKAMEGRKGILIVGDSLNRLCTTTLASVLRATSVVSTMMKDVWNACDDKLTVQFMRNDYLDTGTKSFAQQNCRDAEGRPANNSHCAIFANDNTLKSFDTLVVNSGAHPRGEEEYDDAMRAAGQKLTASMKRLHGEDAILVVRNTSPGHWNCTRRMFDGPVDEELALHLVSGAPKKYSWYTFHGLNAKLEEAFPAGDGWWLLDVYSPTHVRPDTHIGGSDCLHYCVPGPADHWITLLYNIILEARSSNGTLNGRQ